MLKLAGRTQKPAQRVSLHVHKGDTVKVISGKDKGKTGVVKKALPKKGKVLVEGVNLITKHQKPVLGQPGAGRVKREAPIFSCKVMPVCPGCKKPTRIGHQRLDSGKKVRICTRCKEKLDKA